MAQPRYASEDEQPSRRAKKMKAKPRGGPRAKAKKAKPAKAKGMPMKSARAVKKRFTNDPSRKTPATARATEY